MMDYGQRQMPIADSLQNLISGLGTDKDKVIGGRFISRFLGRVELLAMYENDWIAGTIVDAPCDDMTREWRSWKAGKRHLKAIENAEKNLNVRQAVNRCLKQARLYGGSALYFGVEGAGQPNEPLKIDRVKKGSLKYLHSFSRWEIFAGELDRDPVSLTFGEPTYYELTIPGPTGPVRIHPSRVVRFQGIAPLELSWSIDGWGAPALQRVYDAVRDAASVIANIASLAYEAKVDIIKIPGLTQNVTNPAYREALMMRLALAQRGKSVNSALLMDALEEWDQKQLHFAGYPEVIAKYLEISAGAANMPVTRLLGKSPTGLNSTGEADLRHYYDTLSSRQEVEIAPAMARLDQVLVRHATGGYSDEIWYEWNPLWQMSDREKAAVSMQKAQTTQIYAVTGVMPPKALQEAAQAQLIDDGVYPGLEQIIEAHKGESSEPLLAQQKPVDPNLPVKLASDPTASHDAAPRTLYVSRSVVNADEILAWAKEQGIQQPMDGEQLHVTIAYSREPVDWFKAGTDAERVIIPRGGPRAMERFGNALVLLISSFDLTWRWDAFRSIGASWDYPEYQPHITISWNADQVDVEKIKPYTGPIVLGPEVFAPVDEDWQERVGAR